MQPKRLGIRAEIVLNLTILVLVSILLHSYIVLKMTKSNLLELEKSAAQDVLGELQGILPVILQSKSPSILTPELVQRFGRFKSLAVVDLQNKVLFSTGSPSVAAPNQADSVDNFEKIVVREQIERGVFGIHKVAGVRFLTPLKIQGAPWGWLVAELNLERLEHSFHRTKMPILLYTAIYSILMAVFAYFVLSKIIIAPIQEIMRVAARIAAGHFDERIGSKLSANGNDELGRLRHAIDTMTDKLIDHHQQLRAAQAEIVQREKLAAVGRLAAGLAHEIGNPLGAVLGYVEILKKPEDYEESRGLLLRVEKELLRIHNIMQELLGFVRPNQVHVELIDPAAVLNEIVRDTVAPELLKHVEVVEASQQTSGTLQVRMDRGQLQQVALNLIVNACQAMQGAAALKRLQLSVRCAKVTTDALGKWHLAKENQEVAVEVIAITVTDSGPGISAENLSKVFEPFFTTKEPGQGTGLGLYIASSILQVWGGQLSVTSVLGEGSSFTILLPKP